MAMPFSDGEFDLAWSLESGEHMPDKARFVRVRMAFFIIFYPRASFFLSFFFRPVRKEEAMMEGRLDGLPIAPFILYNNSPCPPNRRRTSRSLRG